MKTHNLKISKFFADDVFNGRKCFEVRLNDRGFQTGDIVAFTAIDENKFPVYHPLNDKIYTITYVLSGWGVESGYVVFGIKELDSNG